jgi:hypothetical protein
MKSDGTLARVFACLCCLSLIGCSIHYHSPDGAETYVGLLWVRQFPSGVPVVVHTKRIGLCIEAGSENRGLLAGFEDLIRVQPPADKLLTLDCSTETGFSLSIQDPADVSALPSGPDAPCR